MNTQRLWQQTRPIVALVLAIWGVEMLNQLTGHRLNQWFGLMPRSTGGLIGIPAMPLLHAGIAHAAANTAPLLVLGAIGLAVSPKRFWPASLVIVIVSGLAVWALARPSIVVGASGLIFGWLGFLVTLGVLERSARALLGAFAAMLLYGGTIWGVIPEATGQISWEAHLFGALAGGIAARLFSERPAYPRRRPRRRPRVASSSAGAPVPSSAEVNSPTSCTIRSRLGRSPTLCA